MQLMAKKLIQKFGFKPRLIKNNEIGSDELVNLSCGQLGFKSVHAIAIKNKFVKERIEFFEERINLDKPIINKTTYYKAKSDLLKIDKECLSEQIDNQVNYNNNKQNNLNREIIDLMIFGYVIGYFDNLPIVGLANNEKEVKKSYLSVA